MSTFDLPLPHARERKPLFGGFARVASTVRLFLDVLSEARQQAYEAKRRYPFTSW